MMTRTYKINVARLQAQTGEPRPGYVDDTPNFKGHRSQQHIAKYAKGKIDTKLNLKLDYLVDEKSGDVRISQKNSSFYENIEG